MFVGTWRSTHVIFNLEEKNIEFFSSNFSNEKNFYIVLVANFPTVVLPILDLVELHSNRYFLVVLESLKCGILGLKSVFVSLLKSDIQSPS